jgi:Ran GTPase-activating protein (RanGAP) involved in mRNA processing and transport
MFLDLKGLTLGDDCCGRLSEGLALNKSLVSVNFMRNDLTHASMTNLAAALSQSAMIELDLSHNELGNQGIKKLCPLLRHSRTLRLLNISHCHFTSEGGNALFGAITSDYT